MFSLPFLDYLIIRIRQKNEPNIVSLAVGNPRECAACALLFSAAELTPLLSLPPSSLSYKFFRFLFIILILILNIVVIITIIIFFVTFSLNMARTEKFKRFRQFCYSSIMIRTWFDLLEDEVRDESCRLLVGDGLALDASALLWTRLLKRLSHGAYLLRLYNPGQNISNMYGIVTPRSWTTCHIYKDRKHVLELLVVHITGAKVPHILHIFHGFL